MALRLIKPSNIGSYLSIIFSVRAILPVTIDKLPK
jgi:hypothetical protein